MFGRQENASRYMVKQKVNAPNWLMDDRLAARHQFYKNIVKQTYEQEWLERISVSRWMKEFMELSQGLMNKYQNIDTKQIAELECMQ